MAGCWTGSATGVGTLETLDGVTARDGRGLFLDFGLDGACKKSSGISFQLSMARGTGVVADVTRVGAEADFGGGSGLFGLEIGGGGGATFWLAVLCSPEGFLSQLLNEDCIFEEIAIVEMS